MTESSGERIAGALGMVVSTLYIWQARTIEDSMLADAVGASGVPVGVGALMFLASLALMAKTFIQRKPAAVAADKAPDAPESPNDTASEPAESRRKAHLLAAGLLLILVAYMVFLPFGGYLPAVILLLVSAAWLGGARGARTLWLTAVGGALVLWFLFSFALKVGMPTGVWLAWLGF
ncbi:tripartite tricarboxylate transporter TctB family protein [Polaromonas sp. YR568]|uniref:tripartite tricarboxylate transporter TctB family protein n=1 Tax=Polaromonas sp. YR568 TaxID=1855301 RepID=UPI003137DDE1